MVVVTARGSGRFAQPPPTTLKSIISDRVEHCRVRLTVVRTPARYALSAAVTIARRPADRQAVVHCVHSEPDAALGQLGQGIAHDLDVRGVVARTQTVSLAISSLPARSAIATHLSR